MKRETLNTTGINFDFVQKGTMPFPTCLEKHVSFPHEKQQRHKEAGQSPGTRTSFSLSSLLF